MALSHTSRSKYASNQGAYTGCLHANQAANHDWLKVQAEKEERPVTWIVNKMIEQARKAEEAQHDKQA